MQMIRFVMKLDCKDGSRGYYTNTGIAHASPDIEQAFLFEHVPDGSYLFGPKFAHLNPEISRVQIVKTTTEIAWSV